MKHFVSVGKTWRKGVEYQKIPLHVCLSTELKKKKLIPHMGQDAESGQVLDSTSTLLHWLNKSGLQDEHGVKLQLTTLPKYFPITHQ